MHRTDEAQKAETVLSAVIYILLTKREVKMAGYWPSSLFAFLWIIYIYIICTEILLPGEGAKILPASQLL